MLPIIVNISELSNEQLDEIFYDPNVQSLCLRFKGKCKRVRLDTYDTEHESEDAVAIAEELMDYLPFNAITVTDDDGSHRVTQSPSEITFTLAYYLTQAGMIP